MGKTKKKQSDKIIRTSGKIVECNCTKGDAGKIGTDIDTIRCEEARCFIEEFPVKNNKFLGKKLKEIKNVTAVKVNLEKK